MAASTTGSTACCGMEPWPPRPYTVTLMLSAADMNGPGRVRDGPGDAGQQVLGQRDVRDGDAREQAVVDHVLGALAGLLGGLEQRDQGPVPLSRRAAISVAMVDHGGHVHVVPAGVVDGHLLALERP